MNTLSIHHLRGLIPPMRICLISCLLLSLWARQADAQFAPVAGYPGTTAIPGDSSAFVAWATGCTIQRGPKDIMLPDSGYATVGDSASAIGAAGANGVVSLGDGGIATLTFAKPIMNGNGFDFAVFENGFDVGAPGLAFLELAFVEVSSDGVRFVRFPAIDNVQDTIQNTSVGMDGSMLNNLAGKYIFDYGTPFDLDELKDSAGLDVNNITQVRVIDVVGSIDPMYGTRDSRGHIINDPFPTNFGSSGFDLDAVGVINQNNSTGISEASDKEAVQVYPNPFNDFIQVLTYNVDISQVQVTDISGRVMMETTITQSARIVLSELPAGVYNIKVITPREVYSKLIVKE